MSLIEKAEAEIEATITITKAHLHAMFLKWEEAFRAGVTKSHEETAQMHPVQVAEESAQAAWDHFKAMEPASINAFVLKEAKANDSAS